MSTIPFFYKNKKTTSLYLYIIFNFQKLSLPEFSSSTSPSLCLYGTDCGIFISVCCCTFPRRYPKLSHNVTAQHSRHYHSVSPYLEKTRCTKVCKTRQPRASWRRAHTNWSAAILTQAGLLWPCWRRRAPDPHKTSLHCTWD